MGIFCARGNRDGILVGERNEEGLSQLSWLRQPVGPQTDRTIGSFKPNSFGLYDTAGNVIEWVQDCRHENYNGAPLDGSPWEQKDGGDCGRRGLRGGHWRNAQDFMRSSFRMWNRPTVRRHNAGFRLVREIE
jgi:formylglycine-generating enzyme required for sulfatase activity